MIPKTAKRHPLFPLWCDLNGDIYGEKSQKKRKLWKTRHGYLQLSVSGRTSYLAHRLIADCHVPNPETKPEINHKNGIKHDNRASNLEWVTRRENIIHARDALGVKFSISGFQHPSSKFMPSHQVILKNLWVRGFSQKEIIAIMGFSQPTVVKHLMLISNGEEKEIQRRNGRKRY